VNGNIEWISAISIWLSGCSLSLTCSLIGSVVVHNVQRASQAQVLKNLEADYIAAFIHRKNKTEYLLLEPMRHAGRDTLIPGGGLLIWHIDELGNQHYQQRTAAMQYELSLMPNDGRFDLERKANSSDASDPFFQIVAVTLLGISILFSLRKFAAQRAATDMVRSTKYNSLTCECMLHTLVPSA
jgi:hypothetical protein